ncbi:2-dehydro-3-deoxygalactonokinase [Methylobacterium sp. J-030]|uniref:2-dehydro-3-deoxygalactonokinase n=1 Tax=Methylobacterium sp. J-030 TaxID=2836627 RepID=UPI001FBBD8ED|nr:2-dehydro-3-deoxygalactonokinase [Methylobacterium sp. J-030]MCJ2070337.1 2-dehydro-3-deoxygalactonokinase [Methylobacterium sp. J-030]
MAGRAAYIAVDWGTTNRRAYAMASDGTVLESMRDDRGVLSLAKDAYPAEISALRARFGTEPVIAVGMVGSSRGWCEAPYVDAPATLKQLAESCREAARNVRIVPGIALRDGRRPDVMRGEEIQILGAIHAGSAPATALFCQPGTHNKWVETVDGAITNFTTVMTGELFALLRAHGILAGMLDGPVADGAPFRRGLRRGIASGNLAATLFEIRAGLLLDRLEPSEAAAYASGVLIGADAATRDDLRCRPVHLLGGGALSELYAAAVTELGGSPVIVPDGATTTGIHALWSLNA